MTAPQQTPVPERPERAAKAESAAAAEYRLWRSGFFAEVPWTSEQDQEFHGPHVAMRRPGFEAIQWRRVRGAEAPVLGSKERFRVVSHTCECLATLYELCAVGGVYFIRRTVRGPVDDEVWESPRNRLRSVEDLWVRLLRGRAR